MPTFTQTTNPTPFGFFDDDGHFQSEADSMVTFVKRKLGDDWQTVDHMTRNVRRLEQEQESDDDD